MIDLGGLKDLQGLFMCLQQVRRLLLGEQLIDYFPNSADKSEDRG